MPFQKRKTTVEEYVSSFPTEKIEAMFESFLDVDDQMLNFIEKQVKLCTLAKDMDSENPLAFIKDLELQIPSFGDIANDVVHGSPDDVVQEDLGFSPDHLLQVSDNVYKSQGQNDHLSSNSNGQVQVILAYISSIIASIINKHFYIS